MLGSQTYGYRKVMQPDGKRHVVIEEKEAEMIRLIFNYCSEGYGARAISGFLLERGYYNRRGNPITESTIRRIIRNPLVTGTMIMNKVKFDFNSKTLISLEPSQWIWKEDAVPPIITAEVWRDANAKMDARIKTVDVRSNGLKCGLYKGKSCFSGKIICGICGKPYYRISKMREGELKTHWGCSTYVKHGKTKGGCSGLTLAEKLLIEILGKTAREHFMVSGDKNVIIKELLSVFDRSLKDHDESWKKNMLRGELQTISGRRTLLLKKYLDGRVTDELYVQTDKKLSEDADRAKEKLALFADDFPEPEMYKKRLREIEAFLQKEGFDEALVYAFLEKVSRIVIYRDCLEIEPAVFQISNESRGSRAGVLGGITRISLEDYGISNTEDSLKRAKIKICEMIAENPRITIAEMAERLGVGRRTVSERMTEMKKEGVIETRGHGPGTVRCIKENGVYGGKDKK